MSPNGVIEDARTFRLLPDAQRRTTLINFVKALNAPDQKLVVFDLLERRQIPRSLSSAELQVLASAAGVTQGVVAEGFDELSDGTLSQLVKVRPPAEGIDPVANVAAQKTREEFQQRLAAYPKPPLSTRGITGTVEKVTGRLNALNLGDPRRLVLAQPPVYELLFLEALDDGQIPGDDPAGIVDHIVSHVDDEALVHLLRGIVDAVLAANRIELSDDERDDIARLAMARGVDLGSGRLAPSVLELVEVRRRQGNVPRYVDHYLTLQEISAEAVDESIRQAMIEYLVGLQLNMTFAAVVNREFDEYFAVAYTEARKQRAVSDDPIDLARSGRRAVTTLDFTIRRVGDRMNTVVRPQAIRAAGALFTIYIEGEVMRMFDLADALRLDWHKGDFNVSEGEVADLLERMDILSRDRPTDAERGMHYRRVFNYGNAELLSGTLVNERFNEQFDRLMYEVTRFVNLQDRASNDPRQISRAGVISAITSLQHNLSQYVTGSAFKKIKGLQSYLNEAHDLLTSAPAAARFGGIDRSVNTAINEMGRKFLQVNLPVEDLFEWAERGNDVFNYIADFQRGDLREEPFQNFLDAAQQTILARAAIDEADGGSPDRDYGRDRRHRHDEPASQNGHGPTPAVIDDWDR
jgi:hypothetical protein